MKYHVFIYDGYVSFEIMLATYFLKTKGDIVTVGISREPVRSCDDFTVIPAMGLDELNVEDVHTLLIPGGDLEPLQGHAGLEQLVQQLIASNRVVAGICSAANWVQEQHKQVQQASDQPSILSIQRNGIEIAGNVITAPPHRYADFAIELGKVLDIYENEADLQETIRFFKEYVDDSESV